MPRGTPPRRYCGNHSSSFNPLLAFMPRGTSARHLIPGRQAVSIRSWRSCRAVLRGIRLLRFRCVSIRSWRSCREEHRPRRDCGDCLLVSIRSWRSCREEQMAATFRITRCGAFQSRSWRSCREELGRGARASDLKFQSALGVHAERNVKPVISGDGRKFQSALGVHAERNTGARVPTNSAYSFNPLSAFMPRGTHLTGAGSNYRWFQSALGVHAERNWSYNPRRPA